MIHNISASCSTLLFAVLGVVSAFDIFGHFCTLVPLGRRITPHTARSEVVNQASRGMIHNLSASRSTVLFAVLGVARASDIFGYRYALAP